MTIEEWMEQIRNLKGNQDKYDMSHSKKNENSPLNGKRIIFLGSSVTFGAASLEQSFVEFLQAEDGVIPYKEAVSGTTLADLSEDSYIARMKTIPTDWSADAFVCQLSTNDATKNLPLGEIGCADTKTVAGAIEYIIEYAKKTWNCPVIFYTGTKYDSENYGRMVELLYAIARKHEIAVIGLWNHPMNQIIKEDYDLYMADGIHPTKAGYRDWWTPEIRRILIGILH